jgi:type II secretory pathway pseudopilin PulG
MKNKYFISDQKGFILIGILLAMVILSVMASVVVIKFDSLSVTASDRALQVGIKELNGRESLSVDKIKNVQHRLD